MLMTQLFFVSTEKKISKMTMDTLRAYEQVSGQLVHADKGAFIYTKLFPQL